MIPGLLARKFDVIASSMTITPKRMQQIAFTNRISNAPARLIAHKGSPLLPTADSLKDKRVGVEQSSAQADYAIANWQPAGVQLVSYQNQDQVYADLMSGRLDAAFQASIAASDDVKYFRQRDDLGLRKQDNDLRDAFKRALATILANGTYRHYFDIYGAK